MQEKCLNPGCFGVRSNSSVYCNYHYKETLDNAVQNARQVNVDTPASDYVIRGVDVSTAVPRIRVEADRVTINGVGINPPESPIVSRVGRRHTDRPPETISMSEKYPKYYKRIPEGLKELDIYAICQMFPVEDATGCINHARKKLLIPGTRTGGKSLYKDVKEARDTLNRWLELNTPSTDSD